MKLLLTSSGIKNTSLTKTLSQLLGKSFEESSVVFIPTAANMEIGDKGWLIDNLVDLQKLNFKQIDIVDISALPEDVLKSRLMEADVLVFGGGSPYYLMEWLNRSNLTNFLPKLLKNKVYVGISAGSMVVCPDLALRPSQILYEEDLDRKTEMQGLNLVHFHFLPHLNSEYFLKLRKENIESAIVGMKNKIYAADDESAIMVADGKVEIVGEGECLMFDNVV